MAEKLDRKQWADTVRQRRNGSEPKRFTEEIQKQKVNRPKSLSGKEWTKRVKLARTTTKSGGRYRALVKPSSTNREWTERIELSRTSTKGGGRHRALAKPSGTKKGRQTGGLVRSTIPRSRKEITEAQRQALPKTGDQVPKKGINAGNWTYDHRKATAARRNTTAAKTGEKKGINAGKWHYDHQKAKAAEKQKAGTKGPTTHVSAEKKRTQKEAIAKHQPKQPTQPKQPQAKPRPQAPIRTPRK